METVTEFLSKLASKGVKLSAESGRLNCYAQKGMLTHDIQEGILKYKPQIIALLEGRGKKQQTQTDKSTPGRSSEFPLSAGQKGLYILQSLHPEMSAYNVPVCVKINSPIDAGMLAKAWGYVLEQFPILTARVIEKEGELYHRLDDGCKTTIQQRRIDFADDHHLVSFLKQQAKEPFDLNHGPLTRIELFMRDKQRSVLLLTVHHIIFDGISAMILLKSFLEFYQQLSRGKPVRLSHELLGYQEFVAWEETMLASAEGAAHASYWQKQLGGELPAIELLPDLPRSASSGFEGKTLVEDLPEELSRRVRDFSKVHSSPPSVIFLTVFQLLLHRYTSQEDIIVGMPVMGRVMQKFMAEVGYFVNMAPIRTRCEGRLRLSDFLRRVQGTMLDALYHSSYPFPRMLNKLKLKQARQNPVFQVTYAYQNFIQQADFTTLPQQQGLYIENVPEIVQEGEFDLGLEIFEHEESFSLHLKYNPGLYTRDTARRFMGHYCTLLRGITENPGLLLHEYSIVSEGEQEELEEGSRGERVEYERGKCVHELFEEQAEMYPKKRAVVCGEEELTYGELKERSGKLAMYLQEEGVRPDGLVGVCMERSVEMVVGLLGVLRAGGAYVPLDPGYPEERLGYMLKDSGAGIVLTEGKLKERLRGLVGEGVKLVALDGEWEEIEERVGELRGKQVELEQQVKAHHLAYVIYTSGSTGQPKGVMVEHRNLGNLVAWHRRAFELKESDVSTSVAGVGFDAVVWEIWPSLCSGGTLVSPTAEVAHNPDALLQWWEKAGVDVSFLPTPLAEFAFSRGIRNGQLRVLLVGGDRLHRMPRQAERFQVVNNYGPTECTVVATSGVMESGSEVLHIGRPIANTQIYILDGHGQPVPVGVGGEIYIGGESVGRGYLNRAELTAERFVKDRFRGDGEGRMYRTGDLGRWQEDGNIQYLGRIDTQVKVRGFRIELGEIEARLNQHPEIKDSAVVAQGEEGNKQLIAFYRARGTEGEEVVELPVEDLKAHLQQTLPEYMVPVGYVSLGAIPLNQNGKVDRGELERMEVRIGSGREYVGPGNEREKQLVEIWAQVLKVEAEKIGVNDNFFELGGHSLLATQLISRVRTQMKIDVPLKALFERSSVRQLAELMAEGGKSDIPPIGRVDRRKLERLPLSFAQERLWFIHQLEPESAGYNVPGAGTIRGELNIDQLEQAFNLMIARHENLRTVFPSQEGQAQQLILDGVEFRLERIDVSHYTTREERDREARAICQRDATAAFDLARGPLLRGKAIRLAEDEHILMLNMHHIISDGWSMGVLLKELGVMMEALRQGRRAELEELPIQYVDYSVWQRRWLEEGGVLKQQLEYWQEKLAGVAESVDLATDYPRPGVQSFAGATYEFALDEQLSGQLKGLGEQQGGTLYMVLLAAFKVLLYRYTGQNDLCVGSAIANRQYGETEGLIGMFVNTLALRSRVEGEETFVELLGKVKATCVEGYENQDAPFEKVVEAVRPQRTLANSPLFQVMVILQNAVMVGTAEQDIERYRLESGISKFDLSVEFRETVEGLRGSIEYSTALYKPQTIERMVGHLVALCRAITVMPTVRVCDLEYLSEQEQEELEEGSRGERVEYERGKCVHELFEEQAEMYPKKRAVVCGEEELTYGELKERSGKLAMYLQEEGVRPDGLVGVCMERSVEMVVGLLGVLRAGGAYVPLDPGYPEERLGYMLKDSGAGIVLTEGKLKERLRGLVGEGVKLVALDGEWEEIEERVGELRGKQVELEQQVKAHHLAYVIYTSGSTGQPKGVMVEHRNLGNLVAWHRRAFELKESDVSTSVAGVGFDAVVWEIWPSLCSGGTLVSPTAEVAHNPDALLQWWEKAGVDVSFLPTPLAEFAFSRGIRNGQLRVLLVGGDRLHRMPRQAERFQVVNNYGPTECTVVATSGVMESGSEVLHIGRPIANTQIYILDGHGQPVPVGVGGEIYIGGESVGRGYLNRAELTAERFVKDRFRGDGEGRMYRTGDLGRWQEDGNIQYLGRIDTQVKVRGFRIELGEIEARLNQHPEIKDSAVVAQGEEGNKQLIAFYRARGTEGEEVVELPVEDLKAHLQQTLPEYMVPVGYVSLGAIPLNQNGKVDRGELERMEVRIGSGREYVGPGNEREKQLVEIWAQVLKVEAEKIGVNDNFFELGGHSLLATQLISRVRTQMKIDVPLKALFERSSVRQLAELMAEGGKSDIPPIGRVDRRKLERLPLSFAQERLWFIHQLEPESAGYNVPGAGTIRGELNIDQLEQAFNLMIARHENLRTVFPSQEGQAQQLILDGVEFRLERIDVSHYTTREERDREARAICQRDATAAFDLARGPLLRGKAIRLAEDEHILMLNMHHIISDGWSMGVLLKELGVMMEALRQGRRAELEELPIQYVDYSVWQRRWLEEGGVLKQQLEYWQEKLAGVAESVDLATDYPRPGVQSFAGATYEFALDEQLSGQLKGLGEQQGGTLYMVLLAAFKVLLYRYTGQNDLCVGSAIANRQYGETEGLIGMFVNTLALRSRVEGEETFVELLGKVKATCVEGYENQDAPFEKVVEAVRPQRTLANSPLFQVMVILQNAVMVGTAEQDIERYRLESGISKFDLSVEFRETVEGLRGSIEYSTALYKPQTIERMVGHLVALCRAITVMPTVRVCDLEYLSEQEQEELEEGSRGERVEYERGKCVHELFEEQAEMYPKKRAVVCGEEELTYGELKERSGKLAMYLQEEGVRPDGLVGVCMERSVEMVVGLLGVLRAGGAYVPLDPGYPEERLGYMLKDSGAGIVLTEGKLKERLRGLVGEGVKLVALDGEWEEIEERVGELRGKQVELEQQVKAHHLAYVIYTSGSTGQPKGVAIEHHSPVTLIYWASQVYSKEELAGVLASTSICFDLSVYEIFVTLANGGTIFLVPNALGLINLANKESITLINTVPSAMEELIRLDAIADSVQTINLAGEPLSPALVDKVYDRSSVKKVYDLYGPSEDTTYSTYALREKNAAQTIGRPIANTQVYILDPHNHLQPIGVPGELHIAGDGLARGYLNRPELTQEKFVANPFQPGTRMYKTGDLARWQEDGNLQYLGRIDTQVKVRGFRIELGEIESRLNQYPEIKDSAVLAQGQGASKQLVAFYRARGTQADHIVHLPNEVLREHLLRTLPEYMVPAAFVSLAAIPLNPNGKVDRRALARMDVTIASGKEYVAPRTDTEKQLVAIWAEVLNLMPEKIGVYDNFFELGGHSLSTVQLMAKINRQFKQLLPLAVMFTASNIAALAQLISNKEATSIDILVPIQTNGNAPPIFGIPGAGGNVLSLQPLSRVLGTEQPFYGMQAVGLDGKTLPLNSVEETAKANIAALKSLQPAGPYRLIGHSYGGVVAYEMARALLEQGEKISSLILLDSMAPSVMQRKMANDEATELFDVCTTIANLHGANIKIDLQRLRQSSGGENIQYIVDLLNDCGVEINSEQFAAFYGVYRANLLCYRTYTPSMLPRKIDVWLYRATQGHQHGPTMPPDYGWNQLLPGPIRIHDVVANHFSILEKVHIQGFAESVNLSAAFAASY